MLASGVIGGGIGIAKGISNLEKAKTDEEKDKAQQEICANAFIGVMSALGLKGVGKTFRTSLSTAPKASAAAPRSGFFGKMNEKLSNCGRDMTVNAFKATRHAAAKDGIAIGQNGFWQAYKSKASYSLSSFTSWRKRYDRKVNDLKSSLSERISDLDQKILAETNSAKKTLLQEEKNMLELNLNELRSLDNTIVAKSDYEKLLKDNAGTFNREYAGTYTKRPDGNYEVEGNIISPKDFSKFKKNTELYQKVYSNEIKDLVKMKQNVMVNKAGKLERYKTELENYLPDLDVKKKWYNPYHWFNNEYRIALAKTTKNRYGELANTVFCSPASNVPKAIGAWAAPIYSGPILFSQALSPEDTEATLAQLEAQEKALEEELKNIKNIKTKSDFDAYKAALAAQDGSAEDKTEESSEDSTK